MLSESDLRNGDMQSSVAGRVVGGVEVPYHTSWPWQVQENQPERKKQDKSSCGDALRVISLSIQIHRVLYGTIGQNHVCFSQLR